MNKLTTAQYINFIQVTIAVEGYKVADAANKLALRQKAINIDQYTKAARLIAAAFLDTV